MGSGSAQFFTNAEIDDDIYFAYYKPLFNSDGSCVGMICVAKNAAQVNGLVSKSVYPVIIITIVMMVLVMLVSLNYSKKFIRDLTKLKDFLKQVEAGNFNAQFDYAVMKRNDEITDMCKSAVHMQRALGALIEHDALTGLYNRRSAGKFMHEMQKELADGNEKFALVLGDIDFFKKVNDTYGHDAGDEILKYVAQVLMTHMKGRGFASRWGGEEFLLGFKNATVNDAAKVSMEILEEIRAHILEYNGNGIRITMSFGVTDGRGDCNIDAVIKAADERLYYAKEHGRNRIVISEQGEIFEAKSASDAETDIQDNDKERLSEIDAELMDYIKQLNSDKDEGAS
jgi:diguanylate cyclase (GGDEF)-like protein